MIGRVMYWTLDGFLIDEILFPYIKKFKKKNICSVLYSMKIIKLFLKIPIKKKSCFLRSANVVVEFYFFPFPIGIFCGSLDFFCRNQPWMSLKLYNYLVLQR